MTGLILQGLKSIPVTYKAKDHYKTTQGLSLQSNAMARKNTIFFHSVTAGKEKFLPGQCHRKNAHFQEFLFYISKFKGREKNPLTSLDVEKENGLHFTKSLKNGVGQGSIAQQEDGTAPMYNDRDDALSNMSQKQNWDDPN